MNSSGTPTGDKGNKTKIKYVADEVIKNDWDKFFEGNKLYVNSFFFDYPEESKMLGGDEEEKHNGLMSDMNVLSPTKYKARIEDIVAGAKAALKSNDFEKRSSEKLKKEEAKKRKNPAGGRENDGR